MTLNYSKTFMFLDSVPPLNLSAKSELSSSPESWPVNKEGSVSKALCSTIVTQRWIKTRAESVCRPSTMQVSEKLRISAAE